MRLPMLPAIVLAAACTAVSDAGEPTTLPSVLAFVNPPGGAVDVDPSNTWVSLRFTHPLPAAMADYLAVHRDSVTGPEVPGVWSQSDDGFMFTFVPAQPFAAATTYVIHVGGGLRDRDGRLVDLEPARDSCGGLWVTNAMLGPADQGMGGRMGHRGGRGDSTRARMDGPGWRHENGTYGMLFEFTTSG